jgi:hypothetical protein
MNIPSYYARLSSLNEHAVFIVLTVITIGKVYHMLD